MTGEHSWLKVTCGSEAVQTVVQRAEDEFDFYAKAFVAAPERFRGDVGALTRSGSFCNSHLDRCLHERLDFIQQELRKYCDDAQQPMFRRLVSAQYLTTLGDEAGLALIEHWLSDGSDDERDEVFRHWALLGLGLSDVPDVRQRLVKQLVDLRDHPVKDIRRSAKHQLEQMYYYYGDAAEYMPKRVIEYDKPKQPEFVEPLESLDEEIGIFEVELGEAAPKIPDKVIQRLAYAAKNGMNDAQANRLLATIDSHRRSGAVQQDLARAMWNLDARDAFAAFVANLDGEQFQLKPTSSGVRRSLGDLLETMRELQIGRPLSHDDIAHALKHEHLVSGFGSMNKWVEYALAEAGVLVLFDMLSEWNGYDMLLRRFERASDGKLVIQIALQDRRRPKIDETGSFDTTPFPFRDDDDDEQPIPESIELEFISGEKAYHLTARVNDNWCDVPRLLTAVNRVLEDQAIVERFLAFETGTCAAACVFGKPTQIEQLANKFNWPICRNLEQLLITAQANRDNNFS